MRGYLKYLKYIFIVLIFILFNYVLLNNLIEEKTDESQIKPKIVLIAHVYSNPYWQYVKMGAEKAAKERDAVIEYEGPDTASVDEGIKLINMACAAKASGVISYIQDENKYRPVIDNAIERGIPVVTVDSDAENSKRLAYVGTDNVNAGIVGAKELIRQIGTEGKVGIIMGGKDVKNQVERVKGFTDYINSNSKIVIADTRSSDSYRLEAEFASRQILTYNFGITALFCTSALDGDGAAKAINSLGLAGKVKIICFDDLPETLEGIRSGVITSTVVQKPYLMGYKAVNIIMDNLEGKLTTGQFLTDVTVVRKGNLDEYIKEQGDYTGENK